MTRRRRRPVKRFAPPGSSPGTLLPPTPEASGPAHVSIVVYGADGAEPHAAASVAAALACRRPGANAWLRITSHQTATLRELETQLGVHPLVLEDMVNIGQRPKIEQFDGYLFLIVDVLHAGANGEGLEEEQISILLFEDLVVSVQEHDSPLFRPVEERLLAGRGRMRALGADYLAYALVDVMIDTYFPLLEQVGESMDELEDRLLEAPHRRIYEELHGRRRQLLQVRRATWPLRELVASLGRADTHLVREATRVFLRDLYDHAVQIIDITESLREVAAELADVYLSSMSNRLNEVMKVLTIIATIFMPLSFFAGVYGMNFNTAAGPLSMPELNWRWGYVAFWTVIVAAGSGMLWAFKRRGWF